MLLFVHVKGELRTGYMYLLKISYNSYVTTYTVKHFGFTHNVGKTSVVLLTVALSFLFPFHPFGIMWSVTLYVIQSSELSKTYGCDLLIGGLWEMSPWMPLIWKEFSCIW